MHEFMSALNINTRGKHTEYHPVYRVDSPVIFIILNFGRSLNPSVERGFLLGSLERKGACQTFGGSIRAKLMSNVIFWEHTRRSYNNIIMMQVSVLQFTSITKLIFPLFSIKSSILIFLYNLLSRFCYEDLDLDLLCKLGNIQLRMILAL